MENIPVLCFQVQKQRLFGMNDWGADYADPPWEPMCRFATLAEAQDFVSKNECEMAKAQPKHLLRVFCEPADVAKALHAALLVNPDDRKALKRWRDW